jgi:CRISPR/Cas system-associated endoribonuclease Cas2
MQLTYCQHSLTNAVFNHISVWTRLNWILFQLADLRQNTNFFLTITKCRMQVLKDRIKRIEFEDTVKVLKFIFIFRLNNYIV